MSKVVANDVVNIKNGFWHMPKSFYSILFIEFWERFGFYGLQSVAVLFFIHKFKLDDSDAGSLFASFSALLYGLLVIGGYLGDKILGIYRTYLLGIIFLMFGYGIFAFISSVNMMYFAIGMILVGNIFFKTNAGNLVYRCFSTQDKRLDSAFTYFYMSINIGGFFSAIIIPFIAEKTSYAIGISICGAGMLIALISFVILRDSFARIDNSHEIKTTSKTKTQLILPISVLGVILAFCLGTLLEHHNLINIFFTSAIIIFWVIFFGLRSKLNSYEKVGANIVIIMLIQAILFWILYTQMSTSLTLFAEHNVNKDILGINIPAGVTQSFNGLFILLLSPVLANVYTHYELKNTPISIPAKFAFGMLVCGVAYVILSASCFLADSAAHVSMIWLFIGYGLYSAGELFIGAIGFSMVSKLLPSRLGGFAQAAWYISTAIGFKLGGFVASIGSVNHTMNDFIILKSYQHLFTLIGGSTLVVALIFFAFAPKIAKYINDVLSQKALHE